MGKHVKKCASNNINYIKYTWIYFCYHLIVEFFFLHICNRHSWVTWSTIIQHAFSNGLHFILRTTHARPWISKQTTLPWSTDRIVKQLCLQLSWVFREMAITKLRLIPKQISYFMVYKLGNKCTLNPNSRLFKDCELIHACVFTLTGMQKVDVVRGVLNATFSRSGQGR